MSDTFSIIKPKEATNQQINPSFEVNITDGWNTADAGAGAVFARDTVVTYYGIGSGKVTAGNGVCELYSD